MGVVEKDKDGFAMIVVVDKSQKVSKEVKWGSAASTKSLATNLQSPSARIGKAFGHLSITRKQQKAVLFTSVLFTGGPYVSITGDH